jgi:hypothetical protein
MKNLVSKILMTACASSVVILSIAKTSMAQVNMDFLTEVAESCQKDVFSEEYYQQMGLNSRDIKIKEYSSSYLEDCVQSRYFYLQLISKFPWLVSTEEIIPGYPGSVIASRIAHDKVTSDILDCLASQNKDSQECSKSYFGAGSLYSVYFGDSSGGKFILMRPGRVVTESTRLGYTCPSCFVAYNNDPSKTKMIGALIEWFNKLEKPQRKELMTILGDEQAQNHNRSNMIGEANNAWREYTAIRERMAEEEKERLRRELLGE